MDIEPSCADTTFSRETIHRRTSYTDMLKEPDYCGIMLPCETRAHTFSLRIPIPLLTDDDVEIPDDFDGDPDDFTDEYLEHTNKWNAARVTYLGETVPSPSELIAPLAFSLKLPSTITIASQQQTSLSLITSNYHPLSKFSSRVWFNILSYLDVIDVIHLSLTCKPLYDLLHSPHTAALLYIRDYGLADYNEMMARGVNTWTALQWKLSNVSNPAKAAKVVNSLTQSQPQQHTRDSLVSLMSGVHWNMQLQSVRGSVGSIRRSEGDRLLRLNNNEDITEHNDSFR